MYRKVNKKSKIRENYNNDEGDLCYRITDTYENRILNPHNMSKEMVKAKNAKYETQVVTRMSSGELKLFRESVQISGDDPIYIGKSSPDIYFDGGKTLTFSIPDNLTDDQKTIYKMNQIINFRNTQTNFINLYYDYYNVAKETIDGNDVEVEFLNVWHDTNTQLDQKIRDNSNLLTDRSTFCNSESKHYLSNVYDFCEQENDNKKYTIYLFDNAGTIDECGKCDGVTLCDNCLDIPDACGTCNGSIVDLGCGCGEPAPSGCDNVCGSNLEEDVCGVCGGDGIPINECDCNGNVDLGCGCGEPGPSGCDNVCGSTKVDLGCGCGEPGPSGCDNVCGSTLREDKCGVCGGDDSTCLDQCGVPNGDNTSCAGCDGVPNSGKVNDICGVCGGNAQSIEDCDIITEITIIKDSNNYTKISINVGNEIMNDSFENAIKIGDEIVFSPGEVGKEERRTVVGKGSIILDRPLINTHTTIKVIKGPEKNNNLGIIIGGGVGGVVLIGLIIFLIIYFKKNN